jgi:methylmalonyl-CoA/ethylmalonyl-CoA epimerase
MIGNLNHVALVVDDLNAATDTWRNMLGATVSEPQALIEHGVTVAFIDLPNSRIELLEPLGDGSPVSRFLERHSGGGMHHICLEVDDILHTRDELIAKGAHGNPVIFMHPGNFNGTLIELEEVRVS